jgi:elongation factor Ts
MIDYKKLKLLREQTAVSFSLCKKALEETNNDLSQAKKKLTDWGAEKVTEKSDRSTSQGAIFSYVHHNKKIAAWLELLCETDFVSVNKEFQNLGQELSMQLASINTKTVDDFLSQEYIRHPSKKISDLIKEAVLKFGENIKIGRINRWELGK